jgi:hypothetical protein
MRRVSFVTVVLVVAVGLLAPSAAAVPTIDACLTRADIDICDDTFSYLYGDTVILRGTVAPGPAEAVVLRQAPHSDVWERVGTVPVSDTGRMKWRWRTRRSDAVQDAPYLLRFRIPGTGKSETVEAFVLFGE